MDEELSVREMAAGFFENAVLGDGVELSEARFKLLAEWSLKAANTIYDATQTAGRGNVPEFVTES